MLGRLAALAPLAVLITGAAHGAPPPALTFNPNLLLPNSTGAAEPSIRTAPSGKSFVIAPTGVPSGCKAWRVTHDGSSASYLGFPDSNLGGGDCDFAVGPREAGASAADLAYSSLTLANITTGKSGDDGATFTPPNVYSQQIPGDDRMWMAADPKPNALGLATIYMTYHDISVGEIELGVSTDGGMTYTQSSPLINPLDVPTGQWSNAGRGNQLGNIVARRDPLTGALTLYSIFATPDSEADSVAQQLAGTANMNRVYEAVGTVAGPVVTWRDYEIWHAPKGTRLNRLFPVTDVDSAGHVYAVFTDGNHVYFKTDVDGTHWNPSVAPTAIDQVAAGYPAAENTAVMPWIAAGANGVVDVVWYGASGGSGSNDDPANQWTVWLAQTADGGGSWTAAQASDHVVHTGSICIDGLDCDTSSPRRDRTLLDFFQVAIDPSSGAATIAYADDHASPGTAVVYYTRQCTGVSATTGAPLANDCVAPAPPAPPPAGSTCPGPQVADESGDAPNSYPGGDGANVDSLDVTAASFAPGAPGTLKVTLTLKDLEGPPPPANLPAGLWRVGWTFGGTQYAVQAESNGGAVNTFTVGTVDGSGNYHHSGDVAGSYQAGPNGTIVWTVPLASVGNPSASDRLTKTYAETHGAITAGGSGAYYTAPADRAPDGEYGADAPVAGCSSAGGGGGAGSSLGFTGPTTMPGSDDGNEPSLAVDLAGTRYVSWQAPGEFASSPDGVHFTNLGSPDASALGDVTNAVDASGALYNAQICGVPAALHTCVYRSTDGGHTWPQQTIAADSHPGASDRPWIDVYPRTGSESSPDTTRVYLEYHTFSPDDLAYVTVSTDGGKTFSAPKFITTDTNAINGSGCNTVPGGVAVDQRNGWVYALWISGNDVATNVATGCNYSQIGPFDKAWVSVSKDGGQTWTSHLAWQGAFDRATSTGDNANKIFATISVDGAGQVHVGLPVRHHDDPVGFTASCETDPNCKEAPQQTDLLLVTSPDAGEHWTKPFTVDDWSGSTFFPWIAAGSQGILDAVYYRTDSLQPNDPSDKWFIGFSQVTGATAVVDAGGAHYASTPRVSSLLLDPSPVHLGGICTFGVFCAAVPGANRDLADAIVAQLDPAGGANAAWTNDASGAEHVDFACQSRGPSAYADKGPLQGCFGAPARGPAGGGSGGGGGGGNGGGGSGGGGAAPSPTAAPSPPAAAGEQGTGAGTTQTKVRDVAGGGRTVGRAWFRVTGSRVVVTWLAHGRKVRFRSTRVTSIEFGAHSARLRGVGVVAGRRVPFAAVAVDGRPDVFRVTVAHAAARGGRLVRGSVTVT